MSKKILFVLHRIGLGGSMTSMLNLLELLKAEGHENIDLLIMDHSGVFLERAKKAANFLPENKKLAAIVCNPKTLIKKKDFLGLFYRLIFVFNKKLNKNKFNRETIFENVARMYKGYDTVIAFQEGIASNFVQYIDSPNKIFWAHNEYKWIKGKQTDESMRKLFDNFQYIVCVSSRAKDSLIENLQIDANKIHLIYNTFNSKFIIDSSLKEKFEVSPNKLNIVSVGRIAKQKRFDRIIPVAKMLIEQGIDFDWYIVGSGDLFEDLKNEVTSNNLKDKIHMLGSKSNPYPIIAACDVVVLTSLYEAHPMVAIEGLTLNKPVITTNYPSAYEFIDNYFNGIICDNSAEGIFSAITQFYFDKDINTELKKNAINYSYDNSKIIEQVLNIL